MVAWPLAAFLFSSRDTLRRAIALTAMAVSLAALIELAIASLADALETPRHLLLFHVYSDVCIFLGLVYLADVVERAWPRSLRLAGVFLLMAGLAVFGFAIGRYELAADRMPRMVPPGLPADAVDDTSAAIRYWGNWKSDAFGSACHGTLTFSDQPGASARYSLEGTELQHVYTKSPNRGMALVTIDGSVRRELDIYRLADCVAGAGGLGGLRAGRHEVEIRVLGPHKCGLGGEFRGCRCVDGAVAMAIAGVVRVGRVRCVGGRCCWRLVRHFLGIESAG
jgi:hypothetical protein